MEEARLTDYLPITCAKPIELADEIRVVTMGRQIRLAVCITMYTQTQQQQRRTGPHIATLMHACMHARTHATMTRYNEDAEELRRTLHGLADSIMEMTRQGIVDWPHVLVSIIADGKEKVSDSVLEYLERELGL